MTSASCGRTNRDDSRFCVGYGTALVLDDRRPSSRGRLDGDQWIAAMRAAPDRGPGLVGDVRRVLAWNHDGLVVELRTGARFRNAGGAVAGSGRCENVRLGVFTISDRALRSATIFDLTDADRALARFAEQTSTEHPHA